ncbi:amidohydrolase family protein [Stutzerimonas tarimensis]|uniref:Amidohydrolase family protein n=1 Tax=Stutzerimonas tarimensis TaxID=1507735 RepID=A0ABV7T5E7_9GAMM
MTIDPSTPRISKPTIPGPNPHPRKPCDPLPAGACDSHAHLFGPQSRYPYQANRSYTPHDASEQAYRHLLRTLGFQRAVLVQPSVYGTDNSRMLETLTASGSDELQWRGVAVVDSSVTDAQLERMHAAGVRGIRMNLLFAGGVTFAEIETLARRVAGLGWHVQFLVDVSMFERLAERLDRLPTDSVIDHMGHMPTGKGVEDAGFQILLQLLQGGRTWVKLTGPNRISSLPRAPFLDVDPLFSALLAAREDRCVFGTDWPHVQLPGPMPNDGDLVDEFLRLMPDAALRGKVLTDNPARLYGF